MNFYTNLEKNIEDTDTEDNDKKDIEGTDTENTDKKDNEIPDSVYIFIIELLIKQTSSNPKCNIAEIRDKNKTLLSFNDDKFENLYSFFNNLINVKQRSENQICSFERLINDTDFIVSFIDVES